MRAWGGWGAVAARSTATVVLGAVIAVIAVAPGRAWAQVDLTGGWDTLEYQDFAMRGPGPDPVDYTGLPINDAARSVALSFSPEQISLPEEQCLMYAPDYHLFGPFGFRMTADNNPVTGQLAAWNLSGGGDVDGIKIWMDGRPPPPAAAGRPMTGFTTGAWRAMCWFRTRRGCGVGICAVMACRSAIRPR